MQLIPISNWHKRRTDLKSQNTKRTQRPTAACREMRALPAACGFQKVCSQAPPATAGPAAPPAAAAAGAAGTAPWAPRHSPAVGAPGGAGAG